ncbi:hypothetical protein, partial [Salmonella enterica]|uniref:hypothetical protein n=1 Tax=Salmonella enterica TaxID=28901 RepID=UPI003D295452
MAIETAPGHTADEVLQLAGSLEQASHHVLAATIVQAALARGLNLEVPEKIKEALGSGLEGPVGVRTVCSGSHHFVYGARKPDEWAIR